MASRKRAKTSPFSAATGAERLCERAEVRLEAPIEAAESVVALIESRSREVGLAGVHCRSMDFELTQFSDTASYSRTISAVLAADAAVVLLARSARGTQLLQILEEMMPQKLHFLERRHFDEAEGQALLLEATVVGLQEADYGSKFAAAASFTALWRYIESSKDVSLMSSSCKVTFRAASDICVVDNSTARLLELVSSTRRCSMMSLFSCRTSQGSQLLRQALLQPSANLQEIRRRQAGVEALLEDRLLERVQQLLPGVGDLDQIVARLTAEPRQRGLQWYKLAVRTALRLRQALAALPLLAAALNACQALQSVGEVLAQPSFGELLSELDRVLESTPVTRGGSLAQAALMYAVKPRVCSLLDVARQTWTEALEQIHGLHRSLASKYPELHLRLEFAEKKGC